PWLDISFLSWYDGLCQPAYHASLRAGPMAITAVDAVPITGHVHRDLAIISSLTFVTPDGAHIRGDYVLVRLTDDSGKAGLGEASVTGGWGGETQPGTIAIIKEVFGPIVKGADPFDIEWISRRMDRAAFANSFAKGAIEMALLDLQGQILGVPVYRLLGGRAP